MVYHLGYLHSGGFLEQFAMQCLLVLRVLMRKLQGNGANYNTFFLKVEVGKIELSPLENWD